MKIYEIIYEARSPATTSLNALSISNNNQDLKDLKRDTAYIGPGASSFDKTKAALAKKEWEAGAGMKSIWANYGTFLGPDGEFKQEIPNANSDGTSIWKVTNADGKTFGEVFADNDVLKAYPKLKNFKIDWNFDNAAYSTKMGYDPSTTVMGYFDPNKNIITIGKWASQKAEVEVDDNERLETLVHEVQHWIQRQEGWTNGASPKGDLVQTIVRQYTGDKNINGVENFDAYTTYTQIGGESGAFSAQARTWFDSVKSGKTLPDFTSDFIHIKGKKIPNAFKGMKMSTFKDYDFDTWQGNWITINNATLTDRYMNGTLEFQKQKDRLIQLDQDKKTFEKEQAAKKAAQDAAIKAAPIKPTVDPFSEPGRPGGMNKNKPVVKPPAPAPVKKKRSPAVPINSPTPQMRPSNLGKVPKQKFPTIPGGPPINKSGSSKPIKTIKQKETDRIDRLLGKFTGNNK